MGFEICIGGLNRVSMVFGAQPYACISDFALGSIVEQTYKNVMPRIFLPSFEFFLLFSFVRLLIESLVLKATSKVNRRDPAIYHDATLQCTKSVGLHYQLMGEFNCTERC